MKKSIDKSMVWLAALFGILAFSGLAIAAEFSADLIQKMGDEVKKGKIFVKDNKMRMEFEEGITIMDLATGKAITIQPEEKIYMEMPGMGAMANAGQVDKDLAKIPVIIYTGKSYPIDERKARSLGADSYLVKPLKGSLIIEEVKKGYLLNGEVFRPAYVIVTKEGEKK